MKVALSVEQIGNDPRQRSLCWTLVEEVAPGAWTCGGVDVSAQAIPCIVQVCKIWRSRRHSKRQPFALPRFTTGQGSSSLLFDQITGLPALIEKRLLGTIQTHDHQEAFARHGTYPVLARTR